MSLPNKNKEVQLNVMKTIVNTIPGYQVHEWLLVINPHEELRHKIIQVKKDFFEKFKVNTAIGGKPWLSLVTFTQYEMMEERIINRLRAIAMGYMPFKVELKDFGSFPTHTIFIGVNSRLPVQSLVRKIRSGTQRLMKMDDENKPYFIMEPHITIVRKLQPKQFEKAWLEYSNHHFSGRFIADAMLLLKRPAGEKAWQIRERFQFQNLPVETKQGELFT